MSKSNKKEKGSKIALVLLLIIIILVVAIPFVSEKISSKNNLNSNENKQQEKLEEEKETEEEKEKEGNAEEKKVEKEQNIHSGKYESTKQEVPKTKAEVDRNYEKQQQNSVFNWKQNDYDMAKKAEDIVKAEVKNNNYMYVAEKLKENTYRVSVRNPDTTENIGFFTVDTNSGKILYKD